MTQNGRAPRRSAIHLLDQVLGEGQSVADLTAVGALDRLAPPDRARAQRLALTVLRSLARADALLDPHLAQSPPLPILNVLRLGAVELAEGGAAHGVVNDLVTIAARHRRYARLKGLVNAVLRKVARDAAARWPDLPVPILPGPLRARLVAAWGADAVAACEAAHFAGAPLDLTPRGGADDVAAATGGVVLPTGSVRLAAGRQVSALAGFDTGDWWVQDAAAAIPAQLITGPKVLDLCAAPGGKTLQLAAAGHAVTAVDTSGARLARLRENLARTGLSAEIRECDVRDVDGQWDSILLDAPCSATGTIRRHPDLPHIKQAAAFGDLVALQAALLDHAAGLLGPGGQLVFCTCSLMPEEGEDQLAAVLGRHPSLRLDAAALDRDWIEEAWRAPGGGLRLRPDFWPERGGMDGFFIATLRKAA